MAAAVTTVVVVNTPAMPAGFTTKHANAAEAPCVVGNARKIPDVLLLGLLGGDDDDDADEVGRSTWSKTPRKGYVNEQFDFSHVYFACIFIRK